MLFKSCFIDIFKYVETNTMLASVSAHAHSTGAGHGIVLEVLHRSITVKTCGVGSNVTRRAGHSSTCLSICLQAYVHQITALS